MRSYKTAVSAIRRLGPFTRSGSFAPFALLMTASAAVCACGPSSARGESRSPPATLLFNNARVAASKGRASDVLRLWFAQTQFLASGGAPTHHPDFRSVLWWAVAHGGLCPDLLEGDVGGGAGLWPLALHNYFAANVSARKSEGRATPAPFDAFERSKQARAVHPDDRLSVPEILSFSYVQGRCGARKKGLLLADLSVDGTSFPVKRDRARLARAMQLALLKALTTADPAKIEGLGLVRARIFDLEVYLADAKERASKRATRRRPEEEEVTKKERERAEAEAAAFYRESATWHPDEWANMGRERRLFLFGAAKDRFVDRDGRDALVLDLLDAAVARKDGGEALAWIAHLDAATPERKALVWKGERGARLLTLDETSGFTERAVLLLHRAIENVEAGRSREALREFAAAISAADSSARSEELRVLTRRWFTFVLGNFKVEDDVLAVLRETLPREDAAIVQEDLAWRSALRADRKGFERLTAEGRLGSGAARRLELVAPLARGDADGYFAGTAKTLGEDTRQGARELDMFLSRVERDDADVRARLFPLLGRVRTLVLATRAKEEKDSPGSRGTKALDDLLVRLDALLGAGDVRGLAPGASVFAGVVRVPPEGEVPWPFVAPAVEAPSVFMPLVIRPVDRVAADGSPLAAWRVTE